MHTTFKQYTVMMAYGFIESASHFSNRFNAYIWQYVYYDCLNLPLKNYKSSVRIHIFCMLFAFVDVVQCACQCFMEPNISIFCRNMKFPMFWIQKTNWSSWTIVELNSRYDCTHLHNKCNDRIQQVTRT